MAAVAWPPGRRIRQQDWGISMLKHLKFKNFKSWPELDMPCGKITGIFGTNSSGKTSILQFLLMLKQTKDATDRGTVLELNGDWVKLGTILDAVHQHDPGLEISWECVFELKENLKLHDFSEKRTETLAEGKQLTVRASARIDKQAAAPGRLDYELGNSIFALEPKNGANNHFQLAARAGGFSFVRTQGRAWQVPGPIKSYAFPDQARTYYQNAGFLADLESRYEQEINQIFYLGPLRQFPQRDYLWARSRPTDVGAQGEKTIDAILAATEAGETLNLKPKGRLLPFQQIIAHWLRELGLIHEFRVAEIAPNSNRWQARVVTRQDASNVLLTDVGFGVSQVLPVICLLQYVPTGSTVLLEQPEIHLHPLAQAALADVIIQAASHRKIQILLESHSEHLLLRLQRRIADGALNKDDVKLYFCNAPSGVSNLTELTVDLFGRIENWPEKFMGDAFEETAQAELARIRRRRAASANT